MGPGVQINVQSSDLRWTRLTLAELSEEIEKGVPWWAWLRSTIGVLLTSAVAFSGAIVAIWQLIGENRQENLIWLTTFLMTPMALLVGLAGKWWLLPAFEVTPVDGGTSGGKRIAYWAAILLSVPIGIAVNITTR
jgi:hypothetical protein